MSITEVVTQTINPNWSIFAQPLMTILQAAEHLGASRQNLLRQINIQSQDLNIPDRRFPVTTYYKLYEYAVDVTKDEDLALTVGRISFLKGLNLQLYMSTVCESFRDYLNLMPSMLKLRGDIGEVKAYREGDLVELRWEPLSSDTGYKRFLSDEILSASVRIINSLCVMPVPVVKTSFSYSKPKNMIQLESIFGRNLAFNQSYSSIFFHRNSLDLPMLKQDYIGGPDLANPFKDLFEEDNPGDQLLFSLKQSIVQYLPEGEVTIDKLAGKLNVSRRTLQRRLSERDTNFLHVLQEVRSKMAIRYLADDRLGITEIAFLLGYADQGSFSSAFKSWHGLAPRDYRRR
ncbi:MAG: AraC family transcriptional regulator ligand-binding domain-containing protein [Porticoccaceae bacterium]|nr:AraC family transcriptional regulator ligand-binding domain-containing protein [Porticoccaceae bacterium]